MIKVKKVSKFYEARNKMVKAIDDVSLHITSGEFVAIVGPSGSGKSSLLLMLGGMLSPSEGTLLMNGHSIYDMTPDERAAFRQKMLGFVFQTFNLIPYLTALENVQLPLLIKGQNSHEQKEKAKELLTRVGLEDRLDHKPYEMSVGQQQRIALARMLANDPSIILADEPTGNLDPEMSQTVIKFLKELNAEGKTVVIVTHDMKVASHAQRTITISGGKITSDESHKLQTV
jgi:putative ABC transport system ATP-binding protein